MENPKFIKDEAKYETETSKLKISFIIFRFYFPLNSHPTLSQFERVIPPY